MHTNTEAKWDQLREMKPFILETLSMKEVDRQKIKERDMVLFDNKSVYDEYVDPIVVMTDKVYNSMKGYHNSYAVQPDISYLSRPIPSLKKTNQI